MGEIKLTDWLSAIGTLLAALVAAPAAVYAAIYTKRAAVAAAKAAEEAASQVKEIQLAREPRAVLKVRIPDPYLNEHFVSYGRGNGQYRTGPPVFLDIWNVGTPTIMVMTVTVRMENASADDDDMAHKPQLLVEAGKVTSINIGHRLLRLVALREQQEAINFPDGTSAEARFAVVYFSVGGERLVESHCSFSFRVHEDLLITWLNESPQSVRR
jgi:hypothetical protein